jgi:protein-tyrosine phosphatase
MAAAHLGVAVGDLDESVTVMSAGLLEPGHPVAPETLSVMAPYGIDMAGHRSTRLTVAAVESADLVLGLERRHAREAILLVPAAWNRTFTLKELVREGEKAGPRSPDQAGADWLAALVDGRERTDLVGRSPDDDVADPLGGALADYRATAAELADLIHRLAALLWPPSASSPSGRLLWSGVGRADS